MKHLLSFIYYDLKAFFRDKADVFWVIAWPIFWVLMVAYVFVPPGVSTPITLDVGVVNYDHSGTPVNGTLLIEVLKKAEYNGTNIFRVRIYADEDSLRNDLKKGKLDAGIVIPDGFGLNLTTGQSRLKVLVGAKDPYSASVNEGILREFLHEFSKRIAYEKVNFSLTYMKSINWTRYIPKNVTFPGNKSFIDFLRDFYRGLVEPVRIERLSVRPETYANRGNIIGWYTIGAIGMMLLYSGFSYGASFLAYDKEQGLLHRFLSTPLRERDYLIAKMLSFLVVAGISSVLIVLTGLAVGAHISWNPLIPSHWVVLLLFVLAAIISYSIGALLSPLSRTSRGATILGTSTGLVLAFIAGIWFPRSWLPSSLRLLSAIFPVTWAIDSIRDIMVYGLSLGEVSGRIINVLASSIILFVISWIMLKKVMRKYIEL